MYYYFVVVILIGFFLIIIFNQLKKPNKTSLPDELKKSYKHISHRGASMEAPENTMPAFKLAVEKYNTDVLEIDVHSTKDNVIVVIHDALLDRTTNRKGYVRNYIYDELKNFDAGYWFKIKDKDKYTYREKGVTIPSLKELFEEFPDLKFNIDVKQNNPSIEQKVIDLIREMGMTKKVILGSTKLSISRNLKKLAPDISSFCNRGSVILFYLLHRLGLIFLYRPVHQALQTTTNPKFLKIVRPSMIEVVRKKGMLLHVWTINDKEEMEKYLKMGVDGIMTDCPDKLTEVIKRLDNS